MNRLLIKRRLLDADLRLIDLARSTGLSYDRLIRVVNGYRAPKAEEVRLIASTLGVTPDAISGCASDDRDG